MFWSVLNRCGNDRLEECSGGGPQVVGTVALWKTYTQSVLQKDFLQCIDSVHVWLSGVFLQCWAVLRTYPAEYLNCHGPLDTHSADQPEWAAYSLLVATGHFG
jgi:hypothetical protein